MKKTIYALAASCLLGLTANAQIMLGYGFKAESGTYTPITGGTAIATGNEEVGASDDAATLAFFQSGKQTSTGEVTGYPIGFDFKFGDQTMTTFGVSPSGYIVLHGSDAFTFNPTRSWYIFSTNSNEVDNVVGLALSNTRLGETSSISYKVDGTSPNRTLTIQLSNILVSLSAWSWSDEGSIDLQYILSESDNSIKMVFNNCNNFPSTNTVNCRFGLRAGYKEGLAVSASGPWIDAVGVAGSDATIAFGKDKVEDGLTCTFSYPAPCVAPDAQPTDLLLTATATSIKYEFTESDADVYLIVYTEGEEVPAAPQNGVVYSAGDGLGSGTVAYYGSYPASDSNRKIDNLAGSTMYTVYVYGANAYGANGPVYLTDNPLHAMVSTTPEAPEELTIDEIGLTSFTGTVKANSVNDQIVVVYTTKWNHNIPYPSTPDYGTLSGTYTVGDLVEEGHEGRIGYVGSAGEFTIENLPANSPLMIAAYSLNSAGVYSEANVEVMTSTVCSMPFDPNLSNWTSYGEFPCGWLTDGDQEFRTDWDRQNSEVNYFEVSSLSGSEEAPQWAAIILPKLMIDQRYVDFTLEWRGALSTSRFAKQVWEMTNENDYIEMQVSEDGEEWTSVGRIDKDNAPTITDIPADPEAGTEEIPALEVFSPMKGDLSAYVGKEVYVAVKVSNTQPGFWGLTFDIRNIKLEGAPIPAVPEVTVRTVTYNSAEITWRGEQETYEVQYRTADALADEIITIECSEKAILLEDLQANTDYEVRVRGLAEDPDDYSEWSAWLSFTTKDWPAVDAPTNLATAIDEEAGTVTLSWSSNEDYLSYNLRYRAGDVLEWTTVENLEENNYMFSLNDLEEETVYLWSVMAVCTHDRKTIWANQEEFETPKRSGLDTVNAIAFGVNVANGVLTVVNPGVNVKTINVVDMQGRVVARYTVNSDMNVMIPLNVINGLYIVTLETTEGTTQAYRVVR